jgi:hypothetical protein
VYRFAVNEEPFLSDPSLSCAETVYKNDNAVIETYRAPGRVPQLGSLRVEKCTVHAAAPP